MTRYYSYSYDLTHTLQYNLTPSAVSDNENNSQTSNDTSQHQRQRSPADGGSLSPVAAVDVAAAVAGRQGDEDDGKPLFGLVTDGGGGAEAAANGAAAGEVDVGIEEKASTASFFDSEDASTVILSDDVIPGQDASNGGTGTLKYCFIDVLKSVRSSV